MDVDNGLRAKILLARLSVLLDKSKGTEITFDFNNVKFIAANQFSVLGAMFDDFCKEKGSHIYVSNLTPKLKIVMQKNGFGNLFGFPSIGDKFHTTIPYRQFTTNESMEFEKYLLLNIFQRNDIPYMSVAAQNTIIDNILEVFNNVKEHTTSENVYACGQFFPKSKMLYFTIVDIGETIKDNVIEYFEKRNIELESNNYIEWAMKEGNSTRTKGSPGGLGFSMLSRFIELNKGLLSIMSDNECYEFRTNKCRMMPMECSFRGTIVTVGINMDDSFSYLAIDDNIEQVIF